MNKFSMGDAVVFRFTSDAVLDDSTATVLGFHAEDGVIVAFTEPRPAGYNPAIVITKYCLVKI